MPIWKIRYEDKNGRLHTIYDEAQEKPTTVRAMLIVESVGADDTHLRRGTSIQSASFNGIQIIDITLCPDPI